MKSARVVFAERDEAERRVAHYPVAGAAPPLRIVGVPGCRWPISEALAGPPPGSRARAAPACPWPPSRVRRYLHLGPDLDDEL